MTFEELGQLIREKREASGLSIDDVAARIKISTRILRTIEEGSMVGLPHAVYTKSFIRAFGQIVGCEPQELNATLEELFPPDAFDDKSEPILRTYPALTYPDAGKRFALMLFMLVILAGLIGGGWFVAVNYGDKIIELVKTPFSAITSPDEPEQRAPANATEAPGASSGLSDTITTLVAQRTSPDREAVLADAVPPPEPPAAASPSPVAHNSPALAGVDASGPGNQNQAASSRIESASEAGAAPSPSAPGTEADSASAAEARRGETGQVVLTDASTPDGRNRLVVQAHAECWISSRADGGRAREYTVHAGASFIITYNERLEITFGNAGGVSITHNGKSMGSPGPAGKVAVVRLP